MRNLSGGRYFPTSNGLGVKAQIETSTSPRRVASKTFRHIATGKGGTLTAADKTKTARRAQDWLNATAEAVTLGTHGKAASEDYSLGEWLSHYFSIRQAAGKLTENTRINYDATIGRHLAPFLDRRLSSITTPELEAHYADRVHNHGAGRRAIELANAAVKGALSAAVAKGVLSSNPAAPVDIPEPAKPQDYPAWTPQETEKFLIHLASVAHPLAYAFRLQFDSGARRSELLGLRWRDVQIDPPTPADCLEAIDWSPTISICRVVVRAASSAILTVERTKTHSSTRTVPISPRCAEILRAVRASQIAAAERLGITWSTDLPVVSRPDLKPVHPGGYTSTLKTLTLAAGVPVLGSHGLRRSSITDTARDTDVQTAMRRAGHVNIATTMKYVKTLAPDAIRAATAFQDRFGHL